MALFGSDSPQRKVNIVLNTHKCISQQYSILCLELLQELNSVVYRRRALFGGAHGWIFRVTRLKAVGAELGVIAAVEYLVDGVIWE